MPNLDAKSIDAKEGLEIVQKILDMLSPYNPGTARNVLCWALSTVHACAESDIVSEITAMSIDQIMELTHDIHKLGYSGQLKKGIH
jgi:hypothetical protein